MKKIFIDEKTGTAYFKKNKDYYAIPISKNNFLYLDEAYIITYWDNKEDKNRILNLFNN